MRKIEKNPEPQQWMEFRLTPNVDYQANQALRESLLEEQGFICAYCTRRIPVRDAESNETTRIDHILCRDLHDDLKLDYKNMVICCPGALDGLHHCDKSKGNTDISFCLFSQSFIDTLSYKSNDGEIKSSVQSYNSEINNTLNLNHPLLKRNRKATLMGVIRQLNKRQKWEPTKIRALLNEWDTKDPQGKFKPYNGIVVWFLKKKLNQRQATPHVI